MRRFSNLCSCYDVIIPQKLEKVKDKLNFCSIFVLFNKIFSIFVRLFEYNLLIITIDNVRTCVLILS